MQVFSEKLKKKKNYPFGASPSGKAAGFDPDIRRFESFRPSNKIMKLKYFKIK